MVSKIEYLKSISFFKDLSQSDLEKIESYSILRKYPKGSIMMYEGESSTNISFLQSGLARVYKMDKFGNEIFLYHIYKHQLITELSALNENVITCVSNISIDEDTIIIDINFNKFRDDFISTNILTTNFLQEVFAKTQKLQCVVNRELVFDSMAKVAHFLSENLEMFNKLKRTEVALLLHLQPETLSRVVKKLQRQELIGMEVKKVFIVDEDGLKNIFQGV